MKRIYRLAAEIYNYSYDNYRDHLGINERFDHIMPENAEILEKAVKEDWNQDKVAKKLDVDTERARRFLESTKKALEIVDAENPAESFRNGVRQSIEYAVERGLDNEEDIEQLVIQICYRAADLSVLLEGKNHKLSQYSRHLRKEPDVKYYNGYFEEPFGG